MTLATAIIESFGVTQNALIIMHTAETYKIRDLTNWQTPVDYWQDVFEGRTGKDLINRARKILRGMVVQRDTKNTESTIDKYCRESDTS